MEKRQGGHQHPGWLGATRESVQLCFCLSTKLHQFCVCNSVLKHFLSKKGEKTRERERGGGGEVGRGREREIDSPVILPHHVQVSWRPQISQCREKLPFRDVKILPEIISKLLFFMPLNLQYWLEYLSRPMTLSLVNEFFKINMIICYSYVYEKIVSRIYRTQA